MSLTEIDSVSKTEKTGKKSILKLRLNNLQNIKKSCARLANLALQTDSDISRIRTAGYILNILVSAHKNDMENRLIRLEEVNDEIEN